MKPWLLCALAALAGSACAHVTSANDEAPAPAAEEPAKAPTRRPAGPPSAPRGPATGASAAPRDERPAAAPGRPQLSSSPEGLLRPEGPAIIQRALGKAGYLQGRETGALDRETETALRRFQEDRQLARTGAPDRDTLRKLGLVPEDVYLPPTVPCSAAGKKATQADGPTQERQCRSD